VGKSTESTLKGDTHEERDALNLLRRTFNLVRTKTGGLVDLGGSKDSFLESTNLTGPVQSRKGRILALVRPSKRKKKMIRLVTLR